MTACDREGRDFEIDAVLDYIPQTVIFEQKAAWLKDEVVLGDIDMWIEQVRSRYGIAAASADGKKERPKGVAQLAQIVRRILDGNCGSAQPNFDGVTVIHPVLLVHDTRLNAPAYGTFLDAEFRRLLGKVLQGKRVMPLAIMTIGDLENLELSVVEFGMQQLLADYADAHPEGLVSLHNFMAHDGRYAERIKPSAQLMAELRAPDPARAARAVSQLSGPEDGRGDRESRDPALMGSCLLLRRTVALLQNSRKSAR